jgi:hypothetical protein
MNNVKRMVGVLAAALLLLGLTVPLQTQSRDGLLRVESAIRPLRLARGEAGRVVLTIKVKPGVAISPQPAFIIEFQPNEELVFPKPFYTASDLNVEVQEIEKGREVLNFSKPLEIPFTVHPKSPRGVHVLEGRVKYFAANQAEGWSLKNTVRFTATFSTRMAAAPDLD